MVGRRRDTHPWWPRSARASTKLVMSRAATWRSSIAGPGANMTDCRRWRPSWFNTRSPSSPRPPRLRHWRPKRRPRRFRSYSRPGVTRSQFGLGASLNRPGGNLTGVTNWNVEVGPKRLELARELFPRATTLALLVNPADPLAATVSKDLQAIADTLGVRLHVLHASAEADFEAAFATAAQLRAAALVISGADPLFGGHAAQLGALALRHRVPAIYQYREFAAAGGLMSYGGYNYGHISSRRHLHRAHSHRRETCWPPDRAVHA